MVSDVDGTNFSGPRTAPKTQLLKKMIDRKVQKSHQSVLLNVIIGTSKSNHLYFQPVKEPVGCGRILDPAALALKTMRQILLVAMWYFPRWGGPNKDSK